jgi:hypothetical protein
VTDVVQAIENLTRLTGRIVERRPHGTLADWHVVRLHVIDTEQVQGKADLLSRYVGSQLDLAVPHALLGQAQPGAILRCRARLTANGPMCEPHPAKEDFAVEPAGSPELSEHKVDEPEVDGD